MTKVNLVNFNGNIFIDQKNGKFYHCDEKDKMHGPYDTFDRAVDKLQIYSRNLYDGFDDDGGMLA